MDRNPYTFKGALDPVENELVCVQRMNEVKKVVDGIVWGYYWAVLGPRQIGKTTFLRQIQKDYKNAHCIYFDFSLSPKKEENFYQWVMEKFIEEIPAEPMGTSDKKSKHENPELRFLDFLMNFKPKGDEKKIVLLFDEIELIPDIRNFLLVWRRTFHDRFEKKKLSKYAVIITGSVDLVEATQGKTSPFNIAHTLFLEDFSYTDSHRLITKPFESLNIEIEKKAKDSLISQLSGHPQLLQHTCYILANIAIEQKRSITEKDINDVIQTLFKENSNLETLRQEIKINDIFEDLIRDILNGEEKKFYPYKEYSIGGAGPIIADRNGFCTIRNEVYKQFLKGILELKEPLKRKVFVCCSREDEKWVERLFEYSRPLKNQEISRFVWEDQKSKPDQDLYNELEIKINRADMTILLISENSFSPDFILREEILALLKRKVKEEKIILPVLTPQFGWENIQNLKEIGVHTKD